MLDYCKGHRPTLIIYGNVDAIDDKVSTTTGANLSLLIEAMGDLQYEGEKVMTDGQEFGLLCRRRRLYVLFVDMSSGLKPSAGFLESFEPS
jgi:ABC-type microcin C transport system duplicated ATPase subunit YejF